jgi:hypothetical protein
LSRIFNESGYINPTLSNITLADMAASTNVVPILGNGHLPSDNAGFNYNNINVTLNQWNNASTYNGLVRSGENYSGPGNNVSIHYSVLDPVTHARTSLVTGLNG